MSRVFWDTNLFIYLLESSSPHTLATEQLMGRMKARNDSLVTSCMTYGEVMVKPLADNNSQLIADYQELFNMPDLDLIPFDEHAALLYAHIRKDKFIKSPDAIQLACAASAKCDLFVTNDERLSRKVVPGIQFITSLDRVPI